MKIREIWAHSHKLLSQNLNPDPWFESEVLLRHTMQMSREKFFASLENEIDQETKLATIKTLERHISGEPVAYILGYREFYGLNLMVNPDVLIPRQETELLVEAVLEISKSQPDTHLKIVDVGTGSGAIAISLAKHLGQTTIYATDLSKAALQIANINRKNHMVSEKIRLFHGDSLEPIQDLVDIIVSNPPYLTTDEIIHLPLHLGAEPEMALHGGCDGLDIIRKLVNQSPKYIRPGGHLLIEISPNQLGEVIEISKNMFRESNLLTYHDLLGLPRVVDIIIPHI